jgi:diacylglycerol kinase (ATP)
MAETARRATLCRHSWLFEKALRAVHDRIFRLGEGFGWMERLIKAFQNSMQAARHLMRHEAAFQQELALLVIALPLGWFVATTWRGYALLVGSVLLMIMVEVLNTGIEAACDAVSREFNIDIKLAKDCGSLAVLISVVLAAGVWGIAIIERVTGLAI